MIFWTQGHYPNREHRIYGATLIAKLRIKQCSSFPACSKGLQSVCMCASPVINLSHNAQPTATPVSTGSHLAVQVIPDGALKLRCTFSEHLSQILQIVTVSEFADKVLGDVLKITVFLASFLLLGPAKVSVR